MMQKNTWLLIIILAFSCSATADMNCFIALEGKKILKQQGKCTQRHSPFSTFKIAISLMGFDAGILRTKDEPVIEYTPEIEKSYKSLSNTQRHPMMLVWAREQTPTTWIKFSVLWYSQYITQKLGRERFQDYIKKLEYGNKDISGTGEKNDALLSSWRNNSLRISPLEHVEFIEKLRTKELPVSQEAQENTIQLLALGNIWDDWNLYGKMGGGIPAGWFVGWVQKDNRVITFVQYIEQPQDSIMSAGKVAKEVAKDNLISLMVESNAKLN